MIFKMMCNDKDFNVTFKRRSRFFQGSAVLGFLALACYIGLVQDSDLPSYTQGVYLGVAVGLLLFSLIGLVKQQHLKQDADAWKQEAIKSTDEREQAILAKAFQTSAILLFWLMLAAMLVVLPFSVLAFQVLWFVCIVFAILVFSSVRYYSKHL